MDPIYHLTLQALGIVTAVFVVVLIAVWLLVKTDVLEDEEALPERKVKHPAKPGVISQSKIRKAVSQVLRAKGRSKKEKVKNGSALSQRP